MNQVYKYKWIKFIRTSFSGKTFVYEIQTLEGDNLGFIKWYPSFRKYAFYPINSVYEKNCLLDILDFIDKLEDFRKSNK